MINISDISISNSIQELQNFEKDKEYCIKIYGDIRKYIDSCLVQCEYSKLLDILTFFENTNKYPSFHHSAETRRIWIMLLFLKFELENARTPFVSTTQNYDEFMEQYTLTVFALRRLELFLSQDSIEEANTFLSSIPFNVYSAIFICEYEQFEDYENLCWNTYISQKARWTVCDQIHWLTHFLKKDSSSRILLSLASLHLNLEDYQNALNYLLQIDTPTKEILSLISSLKELVRHE